MAIQDILTSGWNGEKRGDVRSLLQARLREMVEQLPSNGEKTVKGVTLSLDGGNIKLGVTLADGTVKESTIQATDLMNAIGLGNYIRKSDIVSNLDTWPSTDNNTKPLGAGRAKAMNEAIESLADSVTNLQGKCAMKSDTTGRIDYGVLPHQVLDNISGVTPTLNNVFFYDPGNTVIKFKSASGTVSTVCRPVGGIIYADASTGKLYLWDNTNSQFSAVTVEVDIDGEDIDLSGYVKKSDIVGNTSTNDNTLPLGAGVGYALAGSISQLETLTSAINNDRHMVVDDITADASTYAFPTGVTSLWLIEDDTTQDVNIPALVHKRLVNGAVTADRYQVDSAMVYFCRDDRTLYFLNGKHMLDALDVYTTAEVDGLIEAIGSGGGGGGVVFVDDMNTEPMTLSDGVDEFTYVLWNDSASTDGVIKLIRNSASQRTPMNSSLLYYVKSTDSFYRYIDGSMQVMIHGVSAVRQVIRGLISSSVDSTLDATSDNAISNRAVAAALDAKIDTAEDGRIRYGVTAYVLLDSMNASPNTIPGEGIANFCTDGKIRRGYKVSAGGGSGSGGFVPTINLCTNETPSVGIVYFHKATGKAYYWDDDNEQMIELALAGGGGSQAQIIEQEVEVTSLGGGTLTQAIARANADSDEMFQWILDDTDDDGNAVKKIIWHIGDGEFIDALGCPITQ